MGLPGEGETDLGVVSGTPRGETDLGVVSGTVSQRGHRLSHLETNALDRKAF